MMIQEFEKLTGIYPTADLYAVIEAAYMEFDGDKTAFCKAYKSNKNGIAEKIQREANMAAFRAQNKHAADIASRYDIEEAQTSIKEARKAAEAVGLPFSEKLADGAGDEPDPYIYDGSMSPGDYEAAQRARDAHTALADVVTSRFPTADPDAIERITDAASGLKLNPETMQRILDAFDTIVEAVKRW
jgi:phytoene dehydrogenase-like protein